MPQLDSSIYSQYNGYWVRNGDRLGKRWHEYAEDEPAWHFGDSQLIKDLINHFQLQSRTLIDVGAQYGFVCRPLCKAFDNVICFEPNPYSYTCLVENLKDYSNVTIYDVALSNTNTIANFDVYRKRSGRSCLVQEKTDRSRKVKTQKLDSFNLTDVDFIKMDVEGWEYRVLKGCNKLIEQCAPTFVIEITGDLKHYSKVIDLMYYYGYHLVSVSGSNDFVFIHNTKVKDVKQLFMGREVSSTIYRRNYPPKSS